MNDTVSPGPDVNLIFQGILKGHVDLKLNVAIAKEAVVMYIEQRKQLHAALGALRKLPQTGTGECGTGGL